MNSERNVRLLFIGCFNLLCQVHLCIAFLGDNYFQMRFFVPFRKGRSTQLESLFWYEEGQTSDTFQDPSFEPITTIEWANEDEKRQADEICQGDQACYYDLFVTGDSEFAANSKTINAKNTDVEIDISRSTNHTYYLGF